MVKYDDMSGRDWTIYRMGMEAAERIVEHSQCQCFAVGRERESLACERCQSLEYIRKAMGKLDEYSKCKHELKSIEQAAPNGIEHYRCAECKMVRNRGWLDEWHHDKENI